jgi:hypothetical protein
VKPAPRLCSVCWPFVRPASSSLYGALLSTGGSAKSLLFFIVSFLVRSEACFLVPTHTIEEPARAEAVKEGA